MNNSTFGEKSYTLMQLYFSYAGKSKTRGDGEINYAATENKLFLH